MYFLEKIQNLHTYTWKFDKKLKTLQMRENK